MKIGHASVMLLMDYVVGHFAGYVDSRRVSAGTQPDKAN